MSIHTGARYAHSWTSARTHASKVEAGHAARIAAGQASLRAAAGMVGFLAEGATPDAARLGSGIPGIPRQAGHPSVEQQPAAEPVLPAQRGGVDDAPSDALAASAAEAPVDEPPAGGSHTGSPT